MSIFIRTFACMKKNISHTNPVTTIKALLHVVSLLSAPLLLTAAILMAACSSDDATDAPTPTNDNDSQEINVNTSVAGMITRATIYEGGILTSGTFTCAAYWAGETDYYIVPTTMTYDIDHWTFDSGSRYWPLPTSNGGSWPALDFFAYIPEAVPSYISDVDGVAGNITYVARNPQFKCTLPMTYNSASPTENQGSNLQEFILAMATNQTKETNSGTVNMEFKHPFARIKLQLSASHPDITINSITFKSLKSGGTCSFAYNDSESQWKSTWSSLTPSDGITDFSVTLTGSDAIFNSNPSSPRQIGTDYIMVPQDFTGAIEVNATWIDWGEEYEHKVSTNIDSQAWAAGTSYTYTFTITKTDLTVDTSKYTEQW